MENTGQILSEDKLNAAREQLGLDKPFLTQYFVWLGNCFMEIWETAMYPVFRFLTRSYQASGNAASYSDIYFADHHHINPSGDSVSSETEYDYGLSDPFMQLYRKHVS
mgnify:CR=1 FL=1